jgi:hypothetical protein
LSINKSLLRGLAKKLHSLNTIFWHAITFSVINTEFVLRPCISRFVALFTSRRAGLPAVGNKLHTFASIVKEPPKIY